MEVNGELFVKFQVMIEVEDDVVFVMVFFFLDEVVLGCCGGGDFV